MAVVTPTHGVRIFSYTVPQRYQHEFPSHSTAIETKSTVQWRAIYVNRDQLNGLKNTKQKTNIVKFTHSTLF